MLWPIYQLLCNSYFLSLTEDQIAISYKTYKSADADDMQTIIDDKLTPGIMIRELTFFVCPNL